MIGVDVFGKDSAQLLREHVEDRGFTFADIEKQTNVDRANVSRCLRGLKVPGAQVWLRYCIYHKINAESVGLYMNDSILPTESMSPGMHKKVLANWDLLDAQDNWMYMYYHVQRFEDAGLDRDQIIKAFNVKTWALVHNYRRGTRRFSLTTALRLSKSLSVPVYQFGVNVFSSEQEDERELFLEEIERIKSNTVWPE